MEINYRNMPLGTHVNGGVIEICPICDQRGLVTRCDPQDGLVLINICHRLASYLTNNVLGVKEEEHWSVEPEKGADGTPASQSLRPVDS